MKNILNNKYLLFVIRTVLAFAFIYAAILKIAYPNEFSQAIANYKLLPDSFINILAIILPWIEISAGLLLLFGVAVKENSVIISGMLIVFIIAIAISLARGLNIDCGCFKAGAQGTEAAWEALYFDVGMAFLTIQLLLSRSTKWRLSKTR